MAAVTCCHADMLQCISNDVQDVPAWPQPHVVPGGLLASNSPRDTAVLLDWMVDVAEEFGLGDGTLALAMDLVHRYVARQHEPRRWLQLLGAAAVWTASKVEEGVAPTAAEMVCLTQGLYNTQQLIAMERRLLQTLQHRVLRPIPHTFVVTMLHAEAAAERWGMPPHGAGDCALCYWERCELAAGEPPSECATQLGNSTPLAGACQRMGSTSRRTSDASGFSSTCGMDATEAARAWANADCSSGASQAAVSGSFRDDGNGCCVSQAQLCSLADLISESCLLDASLTSRFHPRHIAAASIMLARTTLGLMPWTCALAAYSGGVTRPADVAAAIPAVAAAHTRALNDPELQALRYRYGTSQRHHVASLALSTMAQQLVATCAAAVAAASAPRPSPPPLLSAFEAALAASAGAFGGPSAGAAAALPLDLLIDLPSLQPAPCAAHAPARGGVQTVAAAAVADTRVRAAASGGLAQWHPPRAAPSPFMNDDMMSAPTVFLDGADLQLCGTSSAFASSGACSSVSPRCLLSHAQASGVWSSLCTDSITSEISACLADLERTLPSIGS